MIHALTNYCYYYWCCARLKSNQNLIFAFRFSKFFACLRWIHLGKRHTSGIIYDATVNFTCHFQRFSFDMMKYYDFCSNINVKRFDPIFSLKNKVTTQFFCHDKGPLVKLWIQWKLSLLQLKRVTHDIKNE